MKKLLRPKDVFLLSLAGVGDVFEEVRDPLKLLSSGYETMYGFIPRKYKRSNYRQMVNRLLKTEDLEKIVKDDKVYLRLTSSGSTKLKRDFPLLQFSRQWNKKWVIVLFDIEEKSRLVRNRLRKKLQNLGFGMLQQSVWITPLSIGREMIEFIETIGLKKEAFVLEVSHVLFGDSKLLARKVWHLDELEENYLDLKDEIRNVNSLIEKVDGRLNGRQGKSLMNEYNKRLRELRRKRLELMLLLPFFTKDLLPESLWELL